MPRPTQARGDHSGCDHVYRLLPTTVSPLPWHRQRLVFKSYCFVANRWIRVSVTRSYFWDGNRAAGEPHVQTGELDPLDQVQIPD
ncbi:hypothetical protein FF47_49A [Mycobacterium phage FF47]|uniref:Uncharacterized protein n=2 Tax=Mapvirus Ff47 TaxID=1920751 RepID=A0A899IN96_9CAUD|nr:hypothetical protein FF47_49A [Mycobacterium phage FF47]AGI12319.1 hypothetical protein FF47_49A [Mycobacterium phage FF47]QSL99585.1 hypothetical protein [Mycobacterium phage Maco2]QXN76657.1 hypothetical protein [Mycobacterium phage Maco7]UNY41902.1 hypothetical protein [Mycobacterium phage Maco6]